MPFQTLPHGYIAFGPQANCTLDVCELSWSILKYQPNIPANAIFIAVFGISLLIHAFQGWRSKTWGFAASMLSGCILEIVGYIGRLIIHDNPFSFSGFLMQISTFCETDLPSVSASEGYLLTVNAVCITIAPVFFCAAIYVMLFQV